MENTFENFAKEVASLAKKMSDACEGNTNKVVTSALAMVTACHINRAGSLRDLVLENYVTIFTKYLVAFGKQDSNTQLKK